jgi:hypothetical protein
MLEDMLHGPICILERVVVPDSDDAKTLGFEPSRALSIMRCYDRMLAAIDLDDQLPFEADEIYDVSPNRSLPPELQSLELSKAKAGPETALCVCQLLPELSRDRHAHRGKLRSVGKRRHPHPGPPPSRGRGKK